MKNKIMAVVLSVVICFATSQTFRNDRIVADRIEEVTAEDTGETNPQDEEEIEEVIDEDYGISAVAINETNFPDANFRSFVSGEFDTDSNGILSAEEIQNVKSIMYNNGQSGDVSEFTGIELFPNLYNAHLSSTLITDFNASVIPNALFLDLGFLNLKNVDLSNNIQLRCLCLRYNTGLDSIDLSNNTNLESIFLQGSPARLDVSMCPRLIENLDNPGYEYRVDHTIGIAGYGSYNEPTGHYWRRFNDDPWYWISYWDAYTTTVDLGDRVITPAPRPSVNMYRLYNPNNGEHFYTANAGERNHLISLGWNDEGIGWVAPATSNTPVYRLYNQNGGEHHYTTSTAERDMLLAAGWNDEGIGWYSDDARTVPLYRQYNPNSFANNHNYTTSLSENNWLVSIGWQAEGIGWYGVGA